MLESVFAFFAVIPWLIGMILGMLLLGIIYGLTFILFPILDIAFVLFPSLIDIDLARPDSIIFSFYGIWWSIRVLIILALPVVHLSIILYFFGKSFLPIFQVLGIIFVAFNFFKVLAGSDTYIVNIQNLFINLHGLIF